MSAVTALMPRLSLLVVTAVICGSLLCTLTYRAREQQPYTARLRRRALREKLSTEEPWRDVDPPFDNCSKPPPCFKEALREMLTSGTPKLSERVCTGAALPDAQQNWAALEVPLMAREQPAALQRVSEGLPPAGGAEPLQRGAVRTDAAARSALLARIFARPLRFGEADLARSQSHAGDGSRLRLVMDKLLAGQSISALMLGGSVEIGAELRTKDEAYFAHVSSWINETFPVKPGAGSHTFHNAARSATGSPFFASCLHDHVPDANVDLILLQFDVNDGMKVPYMNNGHRRSLEVIMRKLLQLPGRPALVYVHWWSPTSNQGSASFWNRTVQPESGLFANYYGLPSVSLRDVWFHKWARNQPGFRQRDIMCSENHPNRLGHWYMADLVIGLLQNYAAAATLFPAGAADAAAAAAELPEPMLPHNWDGAAGVCLHEESLHAAALPGAQSVQGFAWVDDTTSYGAHRWGWASEHVGDFIELQVDTTIPGNPDKSDTSWLSVAVLMSYQRMGIANFECVRNCKCKTMKIDALWGAPYSIKEHWHSKVTPSAECVVRLTNVGNVRVAGNRFKLEAFTVRPGTYHMGEGLHQFGSERFNLVEQGLYTTKARA